MKLSNYLGDKPFWQVTARLALPIAVQNLLTSSFQLVDTLMVSRLGDVALSAVGMAGQWGWVSMLLGFGLCSGMSVFVSQYWGVRDLKGIRRVMGIALLLCLLLSGTFMAVALLSPEFVLRLFNQDPQVVEVGCRYLTIVCFSYPAVVLTNVLSTVLRGTERVKPPLYVSIVTTIANAVVNYGLIFGKLGMPALGVAGAALATCISSWLGPVLLLVISAAEKNLLIGPIKELFSFTGKHLAEFFRKAAPVMINEAVWSMGILTLNRIYANLGYEYYAGMTIFKTFADLAFAFYAGLAGACTVMVGKSVGQGKIARGVQDAKRFSVLVPMSSLLLGCLLILLRQPLVRIFATGDTLSAVALSTALAVTIFCGLEMPVRNTPYIQLVGVFRSGGDTLPGMIYEGCALWLISIPLTYLAANWLQLPFLAVVAVAYLGEDIPKLALCLRRFRSGKWLKPVTPEGRAGLEEYRKGKGAV